MTAAVTRRDALAWDVAVQAGRMSLAELERLDAEVRAILQERDAWARHIASCDLKWHHVAAIDGGSVVTSCRGRWSVNDAFESEARPALADRCGACQDVFRDTQRVRIGLPELRDSISLAEPTPGLASAPPSEPSPSSSGGGTYQPSVAEMLAAQGPK